MAASLATLVLSLAVVLSSGSVAADDRAYAAGTGEIGGDGGTAAEGDGFGCLIVPNTVVELGVEVRGVVDEVRVERGERVEKGQTLAALRADVERASLDQALDRVQMDSEIGAREADLEFTRQVLERQRSLLAQKLAPQQSLDEAHARHRVAEAALRRARDNAILDRHELLRSEALFRQRFVVSPIDGVVIGRHAEPGELVVDEPLLTVAELDTLAVEVVLPSSELHRLGVGDDATVFPETSPGRAVAARVTRVDPMLDAASGTFGVRLTFDNASGAVVAGQECRVRFGADLATSEGPDGPPDAARTSPPAP